MDIIKIIIISIVVLHFGLIEARNDINSESNNFSAFSQKLDYEYKNVNITLEKIEQLLYAKCEKLNVPDDVIASIIDGALRLRTCTNGLINMTEFYEEIEMSRSKGTLDMVFAKYCSRRSWLLDCFTEFNVKLLPCLTPEEQEHDYILMRILYTLVDFFCYRSGEPMLLFVAEEGPECIESQKQHIINCLNATFQDYVPEKNQEYLINELPEFVLKPKQCLEIYDLEQCVVNHVEQCSQATPVNMVEAIFRYIRKETKCQREVDKIQFLDSILRDNSARNNSIVPQLSSSVLLLYFLSNLLIKFK